MCDLKVQTGGRLPGKQGGGGRGGRSTVAYVENGIRYNSTHANFKTRAEEMA